MGRSVDEFFRDIEGNSEEGKVLPNWWVLLLFGLPKRLTFVLRHGELYLEVRSSLLAAWLTSEASLSSIVVHTHPTGQSRRATDIQRFSCATLK